MSTDLAPTIVRALVAGLGGVDRALPPGQPAHPAIVGLVSALRGGDEEGWRLHADLLVLLSPGIIGAHDAMREVCRD